ncbi:Bifunctional inhibitor/plant lipid transfer protein/seed storage helical domain [Macleaya cordata]|uniref:Bifunctional inhibitor/plant lipid transfer protein/seed storage helical domain n=1 Tax=Macleaya cordata TaxID=56857 RepID=A0A200PNS8_MACCD|nr:Bifunctional inhibitor/plant lipid transfer protein/seed storage helical domain [Macleaya cordata]
MDSFKLSALLLICMLFISSVTPILGCGSCSKPPHHKPKTPKKPPTIKPPVIPPQVPYPPPPMTPAASCPIDTLKLGACVDLLGGLVHIGLGDPTVNECCPVLQGLVELEAAVCLCTTLKIKLLNLNIFVPLALQLLVTCGITPPPGYTCSL